MSEMLERVHEFRGALSRYLRDNKLENAGAPLIGALHDLMEDLRELEFPDILAAFEIQRGAPAGFFRSQWPAGILVYGNKKWIHFRGDHNGLMPDADIIMRDGILYLRIIGYSRKSEIAVSLLRDQDFLKTVPRNQNWNVQPLPTLPISGKEETALEELFENY